MKAGFIADLHCHTTASDGFYTPSEAVRFAADKEVTVLAITDHDTTDGVAEAIAAGNKYGVKVISAVEISCFAGIEIHILGYCINLDRVHIEGAKAQAALEQLHALRGARVHRAEQMLAKLATHNMFVPFETVQALAGDGIIGRPHVARAMVACGVVANAQQAFDMWIGEGKPCFVANATLTPAAAIRLIHDLSGLAVLAHPTLYTDQVNRVLDDMLAASIDGVEVYHPSSNKEQSDRLLAFCTKHNLLATGGSDFHGTSTRGGSTCVLGSHTTPPQYLATILACSS